MILRAFILITLVIGLAMPAAARPYAAPDCPSRSQWSCPVDPAKLGHLGPSVELPCQGKGLLTAMVTPRPAPALAAALPVARHSVTLAGIGADGIDRPPKHAG